MAKMTKEEAIATLKKSAQNGDTYTTEERQKISEKYGEDVYAQAFLQPGEKPKVGFSAPQAAVRGAGQGVTFGSADEIIGAVGGGLPAAVSGIKDVVTGPTKLSELPGKIKAGYEGERDTQRRMFDAARAMYPKSYTGGEIAGSVLATAPLVPLVGPLGGAGATALKIAGTVGKSAAIGAGTGAAAGAGHAETLGDVPGEAASGGLMGGLLGGAIPVAGKVGGDIVKGSATLAKDFVGRALGGLGKTSLDTIVKYGREAIDSAPALADVANRLKGAVSSQHELAKETSGKAQEILANSGKSLTADEAVAPLYDALFKLGKTPGITPKYQAGVSTIENIISNIEDAASKGKKIPADAYHRINQQIGDMIEWTTKPGESVVDSQTNNALKIAYQGIRDTLRDNGGEKYRNYVDKISGDMKILEKLRDVLGSKPRQIERTLARAEGKRGSEIRDALKAADENLVFGDRPYSEQVKLALAKEALSDTAEKTGSSGMIGAGLGGSTLAGALIALGVDPTTAALLAPAGAGMGAALRTTYGPRLGGAAVDTMSKIEKSGIPQAIGRQIESKGQTGGQLIQGPMRELLSRENTPRRPLK